MNYDVLIIGAGPGGIFSAYELIQQDPNLRVGVFEAGHALGGRKCPIDGNKIKSCIGCKTCSIMSGFGGAGAFSDGKYNITNDFGGTLYEYIGKKEAIDLMRYVDRSIWHMAAREPNYTLPQAVVLKSSVCKMTCICWMHLSAIWVRTSTMWYWKISTNI